VTSHYSRAQHCLSVTAPRSGSVIEPDLARSMTANCPKQLTFKLGHSYFQNRPRGVALTQHARSRIAFYNPAYD